MKIISYLFTFLSLVCFVAEAKSPPQGSGAAEVPANILIMLDTSGSMGWDKNGKYICRPVKAKDLCYPYDITVDSSGNYYIIDNGDHRVKKYNSDGVQIDTVGGYGLSNEQFKYPVKIDIDSDDNIYVADFRNHRIQKFDKNLKYKKTFTEINYPFGVTVDTDGNVYASSLYEGKIHKWNSGGSTHVKWNAKPGMHGISHYNGHIYAALNSERKIYKYSDFDGSLQDSWDVEYSGSPFDIEVTSNGIYVNNWTRHTVQRYSIIDRSFIRQWGGRGTANTSFHHPMGLGSDSSGNIFIADYYNHAAKKFDFTGDYISKVESPTSRMSEAVKVIKKLVSDSDLNSGANFGLMSWQSYPRMNVNISSSGANQIYNTIDNIKPGGGTYLRRAMKLAQSYMSGNPPMNPKASCQKNYLIVISDGEWFDNPDPIVENLYKSKGIQTFAVGFHTAGNSKYTSLASAGGTGVDPLYANNWQLLYETLSNHIRQAISSRFTGSSPVIVPEDAENKTEDFIFQPTFEYKKNHQWKGKLTKYTINVDGMPGVVVWEAGKKLDNKSESSRQIWTIAKSSGVDTSLNNFTITNLQALKDLIWRSSGKTPTDVEGTDLINFVRGIDAYDEDDDKSTSDKRWKLGDIYHSQLTVVGVPKGGITDKKNKANTENYYRYQNNYDNFKNGNRCGIACSSRKEVVYVGSNDGMLHAFDSKTGDELWAFIPPIMLQSLRKMISEKAQTSHSIYGVDGSPVVKDIYYGNRWRTVLLAGMGRGGHGYFALDITNPNSPSFLFAFQNDPTNKYISHWDANGNVIELGYGSGILAEYDYSKLGEAWSTPTIMAMPYGSGRKWVAVFGAGYNSGVNTEYGSAVYVIDLEDNGKVLKRIDLGESTDKNGVVINNSIANSVPADLTAITPDTTDKANYKGGMFYFADLEGKFWKLNLTDKGTLYEITQFFNAEATQENDRMAFFQVTPSIGNDGNLWMYYGTGNQQKLQRMSADIKNRIFGFKDVDFPKFKAVSSSTVAKLKNNTSTGGICPTSADLGWYVDLDAHEKVTGKLALSNETVFASRYIPNNKNICNPGSSKLTEHNFACGNTLRGTKLGQGIATGAVIYKGKIYVGISGSGTEDIKDEKGNVIGQRKDNLIVFSPKKDSKGKGNVSYESWREVF